MQAIELDAVITKQHEIYLKLPDDVNASTAKVIVMYEENTEEKRKTSFWSISWTNKNCG